MREANGDDVDVRDVAIAGSSCFADGEFGQHKVAAEFQVRLDDSHTGVHSICPQPEAMFQVASTGPGKSLMVSRISPRAEPAEAKRSSPSR